MRDTYLFDLDGTLLPMDYDKFMHLYFFALSKHFDGQYDLKQLQKTILEGTEIMFHNDGTMTNEDAFWHFAKTRMPFDLDRDKPLFEHFYDSTFSTARDATWQNPIAAKCIHHLKEKGFTLAIATNPLFPRIATLNRIRWAGLDPEDFALISTYEDFHYAKPNLGYYREMLDRLGKSPEQCIMIGNDNQEDMCAESLGIKSYLIDDCLLNHGDAPLHDWHGSFESFFDLIKSARKIKAENIKIEDAVADQLSGARSKSAGS